MSLFIRLETGFWTHRKTARLRGILGESALWLPPRIWSYAAEHQPDGDFSKYLPEELAMLIGYTGNAQAMLEALRLCGFMDDMQIHGWEERNSYHREFAERARKAAEARWGKKRKTKRGEEKRQAMLEASPSIAEAEAFKLAWNELPSPFRPVRTMSDGRVTSLRARMKDEFWSSNWRNALESLKTSEFCKGKNDRGWIADVDFFLRPDSVAKILEGKYANGSNGHKPEFSMFTR